MLSTNKLVNRILQPGDQVGTVTLLELIGKGGQAEIWTGWDFRSERLVVLKLFEFTEPTGDTRPVITVIDFEREAHLLASLSHPHILPLYNVGTYYDRRYLTIRYVPGGTLNDRLDGSCIPPLQAITWVAELASGLEYLHQQKIVHRDLKPGNVLFGADDTLYLADFGLAKQLPEITVALHTGRGTPRYAPPEQHTLAPITPLSDIYSLGLLIFQMLAGRLPWPSDTSLALLQIHSGEEIPDPRDFSADLPVGLTSLLRRTTALDPEDRPASALIVCHELADLFGIDVDSILQKTASVLDEQAVIQQDANSLLKKTLATWDSDKEAFPLRLSDFVLIDSQFLHTKDPRQSLTRSTCEFLLRGSLVSGYHADLWWFAFPDPLLRLEVCESIILHEHEWAISQAVRRLVTDMDSLPLQDLSVEVQERLSEVAIGSLNPEFNEDALKVLGQAVRRSGRWQPHGLSTASDEYLVGLIKEAHPQASLAARIIGLVHSSGAVEALLDRLPVKRSIEALTTIQQSARSLPSSVPLGLRWQIRWKLIQEKLHQEQVSKTAVRLLLGMIAILLTSVAMFRHNFQAADLQLSNLLYQPYAVSGIVTIVSIDDASLARFGRWDEWPRSLHVDLIDQLRRAGARVIALDIAFPSETTEDSELAKAMDRAGNVVQALVGTGDAHLSRSGIASFEDGLLPQPVLQNAAAATGHVNVLHDIDGYVRRMPVVISFDDVEAPSLPIQAIRTYLGTSTTAVPTVPQEAIYEGGRRIPVDDTGTMWIHYAGPPLTQKHSTFRVVSYQDVIDGNFDRAAIEGKIVLVGIMATAEPDQYLTPVSGGRPMYGVEVLANAIETIWADRTISFPRSWVQVALIVLLGLLVAIGSARPWLGLGTSGAAIVAYYIFASLLFDARGIMLSLFYPVMAIVLSYSVSTAYRLSEEIQQRQQIIRLFESKAPANTTSAIMRAIRRGEIRLSGEVKTISVLCFQINSFAQGLNSIGPQIMVAQTTAFSKLLTEAVFANEGTLVPSTNEQIVAIFNAPLNQPNHALRAVNAAMMAHQRLESVQTAIDGAESLSITVGIYTGRAIVGSSDHRDYTAIGMPINLAIELARGGEPGQTLLGLSTFEEVRTLVDAELLGPLTIAGQVSTVITYLLHGLRDASSIKNGPDSE